jgi:hypothetical protein
MNTRTTAKDFFLQLGAIAALYASVIALISLLFKVINVAYPKITNAYQYYDKSIGLQVATIIVAFPIFLVLSWLIQKSFASDPQMREYGLRKWLAYVTLFVSGLIIAGDLVSVIYFFLDGMELTTAFLLKALTLLLVSLGIFGYFFRNLKDTMSGSERNLWRIGASIVALGAIVLGFSVIGSPASQRAMRYDMQKVTDLQNIQWQIIGYYELKGAIPEKLDDLKDPIKSGYMSILDPETQAPYVYEKTSNLSFKLCANFNKPSDNLSNVSIVGPTDNIIGREGENWQHPAGKHCFERTIDPDLYPVTRKAI